MSHITSVGRFAVVVALAASVAACGSDDAERLSKEETARQVNEVFGAASAELQGQFHSIFEQLPNGRDNAPVPERVRAQLGDPSARVARELREAADQVGELDPPEDVEDELDSLANAARGQASRLEELAIEETLTVGELAEAVAPPMEELQRLREAGIEVQPARGA